jgi:hypothetical protein
MTRPPASTEQHTQQAPRLASIAIAMLVALLLTIAPLPRHIASADDPQPAASQVFATGLLNPRGLTFGPDG